MTSTVVAIHQPNFLPWTGFFAKYYLCDKFWIFDEVQVPNRGFLTRVKIGPEAEQWLTVPVTKGKDDKISNLRLDSPKKNLPKIAKTLRHTYPKSRYPFAHRIDNILSLLEIRRYEFFTDMSSDIIYEILQILGFPVKYGPHYDPNIYNPHSEYSATARLMAVTKALGGNIYLSGTDGKNYMDTAGIDPDIRVVYQDVSRIAYRGSILEKICSVEDIKGYVIDCAR